MICPPSSEEKNGKKKAVLQQHGQQPHRADGRAPQQGRQPRGHTQPPPGRCAVGPGIILGNADGLVHSKDEYHALPASQRTLGNKVSIAYSHLSSVESTYAPAGR